MLATLTGAVAARPARRHRRSRRTGRRKADAAGVAGRRRDQGFRVGDVRHDGATEPAGSPDEAATEEQPAAGAAKATAEPTQTITPEKSSAAKR